MYMPIIIIIFILSILTYYLTKSANVRIFISILITIVVGFLGTAFGYNLNFAELGSILSVATMGLFILLEIKRISNNNKDSNDKK